MTKIIGVSGAHCTGKTSTLEAIAKRQSRDPYIVVDDFKASRTVLKELKCTLEQATSTPETMEVYQRLVLDTKLHRDLFTLRNCVHSSAKANFLVDRSPADLNAYAQLWSVKTNHDIAFGADYYGKCREYIAHYDAIIFFPIGVFDFVDDGVRAKFDTQKVINDAIIEFLKRHSNPFIVTSTTIEDRAGEIIDYIKFINSK
jgi:hypothetical protein